MRNYILTFVLALLVVAASVSLRRAITANAVDVNSATLVAIGPSPAPIPPRATLAIGPSPAPIPPRGTAAIGPSPAPIPPRGQ
ncbi:MAG TPA: hypothetical protein VNM47_09415 [Terriglobia bacterium]|nr:hypothetical protein [Terriglobia bacterium]